MDLGAKLSRSEWAALGAIILVGIALRTVAIATVPLWTDEALTYVLAQAPPLALATAPLDPTPPLYYWLHQLFVPDGAGLFAGRSIALICGVLTIPATFLLGRAMISRFAGLVAAGLVAVAVPLVDYSQEARAYALLVLLITLSALTLQRTLAGEGRRWALAGFTATAVLALYTHFVALFWVAPALLILRVEAGRRGIVRDAWIAAALIVAAFIPEAWRIVRYATEANAFHWLVQPGPAGFARLLAAQWLPGGWLFMLFFVASLAGFAVMGRHFLTNWAHANRAAALILAALLVQPLALWLFGFIVSPVLMPRTMQPSLPAVGLGIALLLTDWPRRRAVFAAMWLGTALAATLLGGTTRPREDWGGAARIMVRASSADLVVACPYWKAPALMAASRGEGKAPLAMWVGGRMRLVEPRMGAEPRWDQLFYDRVFVPQHAKVLGIAAPVARPVTLAPRAIWLVTSECSADERAAIAAWATAAPFALLWQSPALGDRAAVRVERAVAMRPLALVR